MTTKLQKIVIIIIIIIIINVHLETLVCVYRTSPKEKFDLISCFAVHVVDQPCPRANACAFGSDCMSCQWSVEVEETKIFFRLLECVFMTCAWSSVSVRRTCWPCKAALLSLRQSPHPTPLPPPRIYTALSVDAVLSHALSYRPD